MGGCASASRRVAGTVLLALVAACAADPERNEPPPGRPEPPDSKAAFDRATRLQAQGESAKAVRALRESVQNSSNLAYHLRYQDAALALSASGDKPVAETIEMRRFYRQRKDDGRSPLTPFLQARLERLDRREEPARVLLEQALRRSPRFYEAQCELGLLWLGVQKFGKAAEWFRVATKTEPGRATAHLALAEVAGELGRWDEAARHYQRYLSIERGDRRAKRAYLALLLYRIEGNLDEMERLIKELWKPGSDDLSLQMDRAAVHWKRGEIRQAVDNYRAVIHRDPKRARAVLNLGNLFYDSGLKKAKGSPDRRLALGKARQAYRYFRGLGASDDAFDWFDLELAVRVRLQAIEKELGKASSKPVHWQDL